MFVGEERLFPCAPPSLALIDMEVLTTRSRTTALMIDGLPAQGQCAHPFNSQVKFQSQVWRTSNGFFV